MAEEGACGPAHLAHVTFVDPVHGHSVDLVEEEEHLVRIRVPGHCIEELSYVLRSLSQVAVDDGFEVDHQQLAAQDAGDVPHAFRLAASGPS